MAKVAETATRARVNICNMTFSAQLRSPRDLNLRSNFKIDLSRSYRPWESHTPAPRRRVRLPPPGAPRITDETRDLLARRRALLGPGLSRLDYKEVNRQCRAAIRRDQAAYFTDQLREAGPAKMWAVLRPIIGSGRGTAAAPPPVCTPDALNEYYVRVGPTTSAAVPAPPVTLPTLLPRVLSCAFRLQSLTLDALYAVIHCMKPSANTGLDCISVDISVDMFKRFFHGLDRVLLDVVNCSLETGKVPAKWKHALVTAIPKNADCAKPCNTRPISMLPAWKSASA